MVQVGYCCIQIESGDSEGEKKITGDFTMIIKIHDYVIVPIDPRVMVLTFLKLRFYSVEAREGVWETRIYYRNAGVA